jgi:hypothetical protein
MDATGELAAPMPGTCHPDLLAIRDRVLPLLERSDPGPVVYLESDLEEAASPPGGALSRAMPERAHLTMRKCWGPAPYVGRPFAYVWKVAVDDNGRAIAGEARIEYTMSQGEWFIYGSPVL